MGWIESAFAPLKRALPKPIANLLHNAATAALTPYLHYYRSGHFRSSFAMRAVDRRGRPLPWYTYPCIDFLRRQPFSGRHVLEFGAGQSTLWWAGAADSVLAFDDDEIWFKAIRDAAPEKVTLYLLPPANFSASIGRIAKILAEFPVKRFDVVVIDGLDRARLIDLAIAALNDDGAIICDNSEGYGIFEAFHGKGFDRVDFYGAAPGVLRKHCTSIFFHERCFLFGNSQPIGRES